MMTLAGDARFSCVRSPAPLTRHLTSCRGSLMTMLKKLFLILLALALVLLVGGYFALQTRPAARLLSRWATQHSAYPLRFERLRYTLSAPARVRLENLTLGERGKPLFLHARNATLTLRPQQWTHPSAFRRIHLQQGELALTADTAATALPLSADVLQFTDMAVRYASPSVTLEGTGVTGGLTPWRPSTDTVLAPRSQFKVSAASLKLNTFSLSKVLAEGYLAGQQWVVSNFGAGYAGGTLTGQFRRQDAQHWLIDQLLLNGIHLQTPLTLDQLLTAWQTLPSLSLGQVTMTDAQLEGADWAASHLNLSLRDLNCVQGQCSGTQGALALNALDMMLASLHFTDPVVQLDVKPDGVALNQFSTRWEKGLIRATGRWSDRVLRLAELEIAGVEYTLPADWRARWQLPLPAWLQAVFVQRLKASHTLLIDINPQFPFQLTALDGEGKDLQLVRDQQWGLWQGALTLDAAASTFNRIDLRHPSLSLQADKERIVLSDVSASVGEGLLEGHAQLTQSADRTFQLWLQGDTVPLSLLNQWRWPTALPATNGTLSLHLAGQLQAEQPLRPSLSGTLNAAADNGATPLTQTVTQGQFSALQP